MSTLDTKELLDKLSLECYRDGSQPKMQITYSDKWPPNSPQPVGWHIIRHARLHLSDKQLDKDLIAGQTCKAFMFPDLPNKAKVIKKAQK